MPNFSDGTEAKIGDKCRFPIVGYANNAHFNTYREGVIFDIIPGTEMYNANVMYAEVRTRVHADHTSHFPQLKEATVTLSECERGEAPPAGHGEVPKAEQT